MCEAIYVERESLDSKYTGIESVSPLWQNTNAKNIDVKEGFSTQSRLLL